MAHKTDLRIVQKWKQFYAKMPKEEIHSNFVDEMDRHSPDLNKAIAAWQILKTLKVKVSDALVEKLYNLRFGK